jgi:hypothetical protein
MGLASTPKRRIVEIELTAEQVEQLKPRIVGRDAGKDRYEEIEWVDTTKPDAGEKG